MAIESWPWRFSGAGFGANELTALLLGVGEAIAEGL